MHLLISVLLLIACMSLLVHVADVVGKARIMLPGCHISDDEDEVKARQDGGLQVHVLLSRHHVIIPAAHMCFRQTGRQTGRQAGRHTGIQTYRRTDRQAGRQAGRQTDRRTDRRTDTRTDRQLIRQTGRQTDRQTGGSNRQSRHKTGLVQL